MSLLLLVLLLLALYTCTATMRLQLLGPPFFSRPRDVTTAIQAALTLLRVPRSALGIGAASKGAVAGRLLLRPHAGAPWQDCSQCGPGGHAIPGDAAAVAAMSLRCEPQQ